MAFRIHRPAAASRRRYRDLVLLPVQGDHVLPGAARAGGSPLRAASLAAGSAGAGIRVLAQILRARPPRGLEELRRDLRKHRDRSVRPRRVPLQPSSASASARRCSHSGFSRSAGRQVIVRLLGMFRASFDHFGILFGPSVLAVVAEHQVGKLAGQHLVPAHQHVEDGLRADDLAGRRDQRRKSCVLAHMRHFFQYVVQPVAGSLAFENSPAPAVSVSSACSATESSGSSTAAMPPWANGVDPPPSSFLDRSSTRRLRAAVAGAAATSAAAIPAAPDPTTTTSASRDQRGCVRGRARSITRPP